MLLPVRKHKILAAYSMIEIQEKLTDLGAKIYEDSPNKFSFVLDRDAENDLPPIDIDGEITRAEKSYQMTFRIATNDMRKKYFPFQVLKKIPIQMGIVAIASIFFSFFAGGFKPFILLPIFVMLSSIQFMVGMYFNEIGQALEAIQVLDKHFKPFRTQQLLDAAMQIDNIGKKENL